MPLDTREYDLGDVYDDLTDEMEEYAEQQAEAEVGSDAAQQAAQYGQQAQRFRSGIAWARETWGVQTVTLSALTNGERNRVLDTADRNDGLKHIDCYIAAGVADAPFVEHDADAIVQSEFEATAKAVQDLHPAFADWAEQQISDLGRLGDEAGNEYRRLVLEKRIRQTSENANG